MTGHSGAQLGRGSLTTRSVVWVVAVSACLVVGVVAGRHESGYVAPVLLGGLVTVLAVVAPQLCVYVLAALLPFSFRFFLPNQSEVQVPSEPVIAALVGAYLLYRLVAAVQRKPSDRMPLSLSLISYAVITLVSVTQSSFPFDSAKGAMRASAYVLLPLALFTILRDRRILVGVLAVALAGATVAIAAMIVVLSGRIDQLAHSSAYDGTLFGNYSVYGAYVTVFLLPLISLTLFDRSRRPVYHWVLLGVFAVGMLFCLSRGAWVALLAGSAFLFLHRSPHGSRGRLVVACGMVGVLAIVLLVPGVSDVARDRASTVLDVNFASNRTRLLRWGYALLMFVERPILGHGYGAFSRMYDNEAFLAENIRFQMGAHNQYLQILAETGSLGFLAWLWVVIAALRLGLRSLGRIEEPWLYSILAGLIAVQIAALTQCVVGNFLNGDTFAVPFFFTFAAIPAIVAIGRTESEAQSGSTAARSDATRG